MITYGSYLQKSPSLRGQAMHPNPVPSECRKKRHHGGCLRFLRKGVCPRITHK